MKLKLQVKSHHDSQKVPLILNAEFEAYPHGLIIGCQVIACKASEWGFLQHKVHGKQREECNNFMCNSNSLQALAYIPKIGSYTMVDWPLRTYAMSCCCCCCCCCCCFDQLSL